MVEFSEDFLNNLSPREQVYEIKEERDFAIRVFPNGSKTWVFILVVDRCVQRRTLGIYPQMSIAQAHAALRRARATTAPAQGVEAIAEDNAPPLRPEKARVARHGPWLPSKLSMAIVMGALGVGGLLTLQANEDIAMLSKDPWGTPGFVKTHAPIPKVYPKTEAADPMVLATDKVGIPESATANQTPVSGPLSKRRVLKPQAQDTRSKAQDSPTTPKTQPPPPEASVAVGVKRAQLTNGIDDREPIDRIPEILPTWNIKEGARQIFFFSEVTGLGGRTIYHRWELNGQVISEIPFEVKSSWRWRVYSSKNILPATPGQWRVAVVDDLDNVLYIQNLALASAHPMSAANTPREHAQGATRKYDPQP